MNLYKKSKNLKFFSELIIAEDNLQEVRSYLKELTLLSPGGIGTMYEVLEVINKKHVKRNK